jgi:hypothetical protein
MSLLLSLQSESVKIKRSASFYICFIVAAVVPTILFIDVITPSDGNTQVQQVALAKYFKMGQQVFNFIFLPLFIILVSTLLLQLEYRNNTWKQVLTSPQRKINVFFSKFITLHFIIILFILSYMILLLGGILLIKLINPKVLTGEIPLQAILVANWHAYVSIFAISAIQFWFALRFKNFIAPLAIGFCLWFMAPLMLFSLNWSIGPHYPYSFPIQLAEMSEQKTKADIPFLHMLSIAYGLFFLAVAFLEFKIRRVKTGA